MSRAQFQSCKTQPAPTLATISGSISASGTLWVGIQGRNRAGYTLVSTLASISYTNGFSVQIPSTARGVADDVRYWEIVAHTANTPASTVVLARVEGYETDGVTPRSLPLTINFTQNAHIGLSASVAAPANLPTGSSLIHGMRRFVTSLSKFFRYDINSTLAADGSTILTAAAGRWIQEGAFSTYVASRTGANGCDQDIRSITNPASIIAPKYAADGTVSIPVGLLWHHDGGGSALPSGTRFGLSVFQGGVDKSNLFDGKLRITFRGYVDVANGTLDTSGMASAGSTYTYQSRKSNLVLEKDLPAGQAYFAQVSMAFSAFELLGEIAQGSSLSVFLFPYAQAGEYSEAGLVIGDAVYPDDDQLVVVPAVPGARMLSGGAMVDGYSFTKNPVTPVLGLSNATANQAIVINGNGAVFQRTGTIPTSEAKRAVISTEAGISPATGWSSSVTVSGSQAISVTVNYPSNGTTATVRSSYPDAAVAGNTKAKLNAPTLVIYVRAGGSTVRRFTAGLVDGVSQTVIISNWAANVDTASPSTSTATTFSLFMPTSASVATDVASGNLPAGTIEVAAAFEYDGNQVTRISHAVADGCLPVLSTSLSDAIAGAKGYTTTTANFTQPADSANVTVSVGNSAFLAAGQVVYLTTGGYYNVVGTPGATSVTLQNLGYSTNAAPAAMVPSGSQLVPAGKTGVDGAPGFGIRYTFNSTTTSPPATGQIRFNNATAASVTQVFVHETSRLSVDMSAVLAQVVAGSVLYVFDENDNGAYAYFSVTSQTDAGSSRTFAVTHLASAGTLSGGVTLAYAIKGTTGDTGATGSTGATGVAGVSGVGARYFFDGTTNPSGISAGQLRFNNASPASATLIYLHESDRNSLGIATLLDQITDGSVIQIAREGTTDSYSYYTLTSQADNGAYRTLTVSHLATVGSLSGDLVLQFSQRGSVGAVSAASALVLQEQGSTVTTAADEIKLFDLNNVLKWRLESDGAEYTVAATDRAQAYSKAQATTRVNLSYSSTVSVDASLSNVFSLTLTGNATLADPTNLFDGQTLNFIVKQDSTGGRTLSFGGKYKIPTGQSIDAAASKRSVISCVYDSTDDFLYCNIAKNY